MVVGGTIISTIMVAIWYSDSLRCFYLEFEVFVSLDCLAINSPKTRPSPKENAYNLLDKKKVVP